jgi:hypothetical protein
MNQTTPIQIISGDHQAIIKQTINSLDTAGLQVMCSFDLQVARESHTNCACPHHGTEQCSCQLVVLLVYQNGKQLVTLVVHGHDSDTELSIVESPNQQADPDLVATIRQVFTKNNPFLKNNLWMKPHAA